MMKATLRNIDSFWNYDPNTICHLVNVIVYCETTSKNILYKSTTDTQKVNINIMQT